MRYFLEGMATPADEASTTTPAIAALDRMSKLGIVVTARSDSLKNGGDGWESKTLPAAENQENFEPDVVGSGSSGDSLALEGHPGDEDDR